jgi:hypothetical protein
LILPEKNFTTTKENQTTGILPDIWQNTDIRICIKSGKFRTPGKTRTSGNSRDTHRAEKFVDGNPAELVGDAVVRVVGHFVRVAVVRRAVVVVQVAAEVDVVLESNNFVR